MTISPTDTTTAPAAGSSSTTQTSGANGTNSTLSNSELDQLSNPQLFLQLLIAELQNQDPTAPMDPSTILQQTSELSQMEAVTNMSTSIDSDVSASQANEATGLIGRQITASVNGSTVTGVVSEINLSASGSPQLTLTGSTTPVDLSDVTQVAAAGTTTDTSGSTTSGSSATGSTGTGSTGSTGSGSTDSGASGSTSDVTPAAGAATSSGAATSPAASSNSGLTGAGSTSAGSTSAGPTSAGSTTAGGGSAAGTGSGTGGAV